MHLTRTQVPDPTLLQAFECAARHGSFTKAADELSLTQSAVSRQIKTLEAQLGVTLFERVRKRVILSAAGHQLLPQISRLLAQSEELVMTARAIAAGDDVLSIATLPTFGNRWLMPRLPDFMARHPGLMVDVASRSRPFDLTAEHFDLAIHYGQPVWAQATCKYLCSETILPVASPALLQRAHVSRPQDLEKTPLLQLATRPGLWAEWFQLQGIDSQNAYKGSRFDEFSMIIEAAVRDVGIALLPLYLIENEIESGKLQIVFDRPMSTDNAYYIVLPYGKQDQSMGQAFQSWLLDQVRSKPDRAGSDIIAGKIE